MLPDYPLEGRRNFTVLKTYASPEARYQHSRWWLTFSLPIGYYYYHVADRLVGTNSRSRPSYLLISITASSQSRQVVTRKPSLCLTSETSLLRHHPQKACSNGRSCESHPSSLEDGRVVTDKGKANVRLSSDCVIETHHLALCQSFFQIPTGQSAPDAKPAVHGRPHSYCFCYLWKQHFRHSTQWWHQQRSLVSQNHRRH